MENDFLKGINLNKYLVLKYEDIDNALNKHSYLENYLDEIVSRINDMRLKSGKTIWNKYLVINTDESYVPEIVEILKRNGHWG